MAESRVKLEKVKQRALNKITEHQKTVKKWLFLMNCCLLFDDKKELLHATHVFAAKIAERENDLIPTIQLSLWECLNAESDKFIDLLKRIIQRGSKVNITSCANYITTLFTIIKKFKDGGYDASAIEENFNLVNIKRKISQEDVISYVYNYKKEESNPVGAYSEGVRSLLDWAHGLDESEKNKSQQLTQKREKVGIALISLMNQFWKIIFCMIAFYIFSNIGEEKLSTYAMDNFNITTLQFQIAVGLSSVFIGFLSSGLSFRIEKKIDDKNNQKIYKEFQEKRAQLSKELLNDLHQFLSIEVVEFVDEKKPTLNIRLAKNPQAELPSLICDEKIEAIAKEKKDKPAKPESSKAKIIRMIRQSEDKENSPVQEYLKTETYYQRTVVNGKFITLFRLPKHVKKDMKRRASEDYYDALMNAFKSASIRIDGNPCIKRLTGHSVYSYEVKPHLHIPDRLLSIPQRDEEGKEFHLITTYSAKGLH